MNMTLSRENVIRLHRLTEVSRALTWSLPLEAVLELAADCCVDLLDASRVGVLLEDDDGLLRVHASRGLDSHAADAFAARPDEHIVRHLEPLFGPGSAGRFLGAPLILGGRVRGLLAVDRGEVSNAREQEEWLLSALADQTALAIEGARGERTRRDLEARVDVMEQNRMQTIRALRMAGHDLRTPLNSMQGYLELIMNGVFGELEERQSDIIRRVLSIGRHLNAVLDNALEMARLSTRYDQPVLSDVRARTVVKQAVTIITPHAREKNLDIVFDVDHALHVHANADRLRQVLLHLLDNAVKYAPAGTTIRVTSSISPSDGCACLIVSDQGDGIPADQAEAIFEPGHRLAGPDDPGGTGLGLTIARGMLREMGGELRLLPPEGRGARFEVKVAVGNG